MSTPKGVKNLWKNINWKSKEEKIAFYNKYFKNFDYVIREKNDFLNDFKTELLYFIDKNVIIKNGKESIVTINDIKNKLR